MAFLISFISFHHAFITFHPLVINFKNLTGSVVLNYRTLLWDVSRGGQTPWLVVRSAYSDRISDIRSKVLNYRNFSKKFSKRSKPKHRPNSRYSIETVKLSKFFAKKKKDLNINIEFLRHLRNECRNSVGGEGEKKVQEVWEPWRSRSVGHTVHLAPGISRPLPPSPHPRAILNSRIGTKGRIRPWNRFLDSINV